MRSVYIVSFVLALLIGSFSSTASAANSQTVVYDCAIRVDICAQVHKSAGSLIQANIPMVCADVYQNHPGKIDAVIKDENGVIINADNEHHRPFIGTHAVVCIGIADYVSKALSIIWCLDRDGEQGTHVVFRGKSVIGRYMRGEKAMVADLRWVPGLPTDPNPL